MGTKTFSEFKDDLKFGLGQRDDLASYLGGWVNTAYRTLTTGNRFWQIKRNFRFPELEASDTATTVAGTAYVSTPSGAMVVQRVHDTTNDVKLNKIGWGTYVGYTGRASSTSRGKPSEWARRGDYIYVHPTPDDEYEIPSWTWNVVQASGCDEIVRDGQGWYDLIQTLTMLAEFHSTDEDDSHTAPIRPEVALAEAVNLIRTHAIPEDHPLSNL
jgi:hypothetical protein